MPYFFRLLSTIPVIWSFTYGIQQVGSRQSEPRACSSGSPADHEGEAKAIELLGPGLGEFILIAEGEFTMGRERGENADERPEHSVALSSFNVGRTPVTNSQFARFLNEAQISAKDYFLPQARFSKSAIVRADGAWTCIAGCENDAASCQSWVLAEKYCGWLSAETGRRCRLPTEAEWEYVCRGKEGRRFPWGDDTTALDRKIWPWRGWKADQPNLSPVGRFLEGATPEGVCDLIGYMDEVCSDWYDPKYYAKSAEKDPTGPMKPFESKRYKEAKVARGGLERRYHSGTGIDFFRDSQFFGVLPSTYLPRGWSRGRAGAPKEPRLVNGRLGFRVVVEENPGAKHE